EYVLSQQLLKCGTSIGANIQEAQAAQTKPDFIAKMSIASKEARETKYWLYLIHQSQIIEIDVNSLTEKIIALINLLTKIVKTSQDNLRATK
ncbi:MAG: four helix bundle protein, partial [Cyclobacteriaceae bacterium]